MSLRRSTLVFCVAAMATGCGMVGGASDQVSASEVPPFGAEATDSDDAERSGQSADAQTPDTSAEATETIVIEEAAEETDGAATALEVSCTPPPAGVTEIVVAPPWEVGEIRQLELIISRYRADQPISGSSSTPVEVEVLASNDGVVEFVWNTDATVLTIDDAGIPEAQVAKALSELPPNPGLRYQIVANANQWFVLDNLDDQRSYMVDVLAWQSELSGQDSGQADAFSAELSDEQFRSLVAKEPQIWHSVDGVTIPAVGSFTVSDQLPNMMGGPPFDAITEVEMVTLADDYGCVVFESTTTIDPVTGPAAVKALMEAIGNEMTDAEFAAQFDEFKSENHILYRYDHGSGFLRAVVATQRVELGGEVVVVDGKTIIDRTDDQ